VSYIPNSIEARDVVSLLHMAALAYSRNQPF